MKGKTEQEMLKDKLLLAISLKHIDTLTTVISELAQTMRDGFMAIRERNELIDKEIKFLEENIQYINNALAIYMYDENVDEYN